MNEQELRALVREAVERHLGRPAEREPGKRRAESKEQRAKSTRELLSALSSLPSALPGHASHILLRVLPGSEAEDGMCVIEPSVRCNHCGFCQSHGH